MEHYFNGTQLLSPKKVKERPVKHLECQIAKNQKSTHKIHQDIEQSLFINKSCFHELIPIGKALGTGTPSSIRSIPRVYKKTQSAPAAHSLTQYLFWDQAFFSIVLIEWLKIVTQYLVQVLDRNVYLTVSIWSLVLFLFLIHIIL